MRLRASSLGYFAGASLLVLAASCSTVVPLGLDGADSGGGGATCGSGTCESGELCCNVAQSSGVCAPFCLRGSECPAVACETQCNCPAGDVCCSEPGTGPESGVCTSQCVTGSSCPAVACTVPSPPGKDAGPGKDGPATDSGPTTDGGPAGCVETPVQGEACTQGQVPCHPGDPCCEGQWVCDGMNQWLNAGGACDCIRDAGTLADAGGTGVACGDVTCAVGQLCCPGPVVPADGGGGVCFTGTMCEEVLSRREFKDDIVYVDTESRDALARDALAMHLARYRYKTEPADARRRLGFIIDDQPDPSPAVDGDRTHVDQYGYASMLLAAVQAEADEITQLKSRLNALERPQCSSAPE